MMVHKFAAGRLRKSKPRTMPVTVLRVRPMVWREALRVAGGDARRILVVDAETVIVINQ